MILAFERVADEQIMMCGGKGASLVTMVQAGLPVPEGYVVMPGTGAQEVQDFAAGLSDGCTYAVRSSALNEDGADASFAGAYETVTDVRRDDIASAFSKVLSSASSERVARYTEAVNAGEAGTGAGIAVVIQRFVKPEMAGVVFTSDVITGSAAIMTGNYVRGEGELLVSGASDAETFTFNNMRYAYDGPEDLRRCAKKLYKCCCYIKEIYQRPMDIEWAVSGGKVYILQARPITTLRRVNKDTYDVNSSRAGEYLLTRTNVGEIFMRPVSPVTFSVLEVISSKLIQPGFIDYINGQAYMNLSVICSAMVALGVPEKTAYSKIEELGGKLPEGVTVPIFPMKRREILRRIFALLRPKSSKAGKGYTLADYPSVLDLIHSAPDCASLRALYDSDIIPYINGGLGAIAKGVNVGPLFGTASKVEALCGEDLGRRIMAGSLGVIDSMKPLLLLEDAAAGRITGEEYARQCGHRHANEMELSCPYPYEDPAFPAALIEEHVRSGVDVHAMKKAQEEEYRAALREFDERFPSASKRRRLDKLLARFVKANEDRERVRSEGVRIFVVLRQFLLKAGTLTGIGDDIFMLYIDEVLALLGGDRSALAHVPARRANYERYLGYPNFPNLILGRFDPDKWVADPARRSDAYGVAERRGEGGSGESDPGSCVRGFPGAAGTVTGRARVIYDIAEAESLQEGEILVTTATNIGWTVIFPRAAAVVTDIGAPLSHAAIVAREFGIPAVVGCGNATTVIKTGDLITVDGAAGTVTRPERTIL
ncbi:pyruvate, water dikinase [Ruminococcaceae bacterium YRB3002]|nr:pyruvate, water dikinase [Ruminococcaceae bacterium YRB3002]